MKLLIVESPNKCKKIQGILDSLYSPGDWAVAASVGHIRDLPAKELGVDRTDRYKPAYVIQPEKRDTVQKLKSLSQRAGAGQVYLATDPDREGEAIAYHLAVSLGLPTKTTRRVTFQEITATAIKAAIENPRLIDLDLVSAQEARRVIDRLAGYEMSSIVSRKLGKPLAAGRVQSVALKLCVEREAHIRGFSPKTMYKLHGQFLTPASEVLKATYQLPLPDKAQALLAMQILSRLPFQVVNIEKNPTQRHPKAAFTTSTLTQEAIRKFNKGPSSPGAIGNQRWTAKRVMEVAQKLFEQGHITYMRTDSPNLSQEAKAEIKTLLTSQGRSTYFQDRNFPAKADAQEAHEAVRPTHFELATAGDDAAQQQVYRLIHDRAVASQMKPALIDVTRIGVAPVPAEHHNHLFVASASVITQKGYLLVYEEENEEEAETADEDGQNATLSASVNAGDALTLVNLDAKQMVSQPPKRFDEASLIAELERRGIGRPSTFASIMSAITTRAYVTLETTPPRVIEGGRLSWSRNQNSLSESKVKLSIGGDKQKLTPSHIGQLVNAFLDRCFAQTVDFTFTANMEAQLDEIMRGKKSYGSVVENFDKTHQAMLGIARQEPDPVPKTKLIGQIDGDDARWGVSDKTGKAYIMYRKAFYPMPGDTIPQSVTLDMVQEAFALKANAQTAYDANTLSTVPDGKLTYHVRRGQYGIYVTDGKVSASLKDITDEQAKVMTAEAIRKRLVEYRAYKSSQASSKGGKAGSKARPKTSSASRNA